MPVTRRFFIKKSLSFIAYASTAGSALLKTGLSFAAWPAQNFAAQQYKQTKAALFAGQEIKTSSKIKLKLPRIAENGAVVPITVDSSLKNVTAIYILVEKNPVPLAAEFTLFPGTDAFVAGRIKMAETCDVVAVVNSGGQLYSAKKSVKVTIGGCGG